MKKAKKNKNKNKTRRQMKMYQKIFKYKIHVIINFIAHPEHHLKW